MLGDYIYNKRFNIDEIDQKQSDLFDYFFDFTTKTKPKSKKRQEKKKKTFSIASKVFKKVESLLSMLLRVDYFQ